MHVYCEEFNRVVSKCSQAVARRGQDLAPMARSPSYQYPCGSTAASCIIVNAVLVSTDARPLYLI